VCRHSKLINTCQHNLNSLRRSIEEKSLYDHVIYNDRVDQAFAQLSQVAKRALAGETGSAPLADEPAGPQQVHVKSGGDMSVQHSDGRRPNTSCTLASRSAKHAKSNTRP